MTGGRDDEARDDHWWSTDGTLREGYFWVCSCGQRSASVYPSTGQAADAAEEHARTASRR